MYVVSIQVDPLRQKVSVYLYLTSIEPQLQFGRSEKKNTIVNRDRCDFIEPAIFTCLVSCKAFTELWRFDAEKCYDWEVCSYIIVHYSDWGVHYSSSVKRVLHERAAAHHDT
jgi:hypothetical protein